METSFDRLGERARELLAGAVEAACPEEEPRRHFSAFDDGQVNRAVELANSWWRLADERGGEEGVAAVLDEAERLVGEADVPGTVRYALQLFMTHHPRGRLLGMPTLAEIQPETARARANAKAIADADPDDLEKQLFYFREDELANEHHWHWHRVYPTRRNSRDEFLAAERQGELFVYMHQQMLARYDTERIALGLDPVAPLDYTVPVPEGYESSIPVPFPSREPGRTVDAERIERLEARRAEVEAAIAALDPHGEAERIEAINRIGAAVEAAHTVDDPPDAAGLHNIGHSAVARLSPDPFGVMRATTQAIRDPVFWRWHRRIDDFAFRWQERFSDGHDLTDGAAPVEIRDGDAILALLRDVPGAGAADFDLGSWARERFGGGAFDAEPGDPATDELVTRMVVDEREVDEIDRETGKVVVDPDTGRPRRTTIEEEHLEHEELVMLFRVRNTVGRPVDATLRVFLVAGARAGERRFWIEMDKFHVRLAAQERRVVARPARLSSVIRKPARMSGRSIPTPPGERADYCECGWPYNLLLPRGTPEGMPFKLAVVATDTGRDTVPDEDRCGSTSFCGVRTRRYPDTRPMGYPFDLPFPGGVVESLRAQPHAAVRDLTIRFDRSG
ncbi:MAG TPA: tyrosinase family protein [Thermoleophilaceae bacterium]